MDRSLARLLVDSLRRDPVARLDTETSSIPLATLLEAADEHRIAPAVYRYLQPATNAPEPWLQPLRARYESQMIRHLTTAADLAVVADTLGNVSVPWLAMKGPVLADHVWPRPDMREYFDLDVLVDRGSFAAAIAALENAGAKLLDRNWPLICQQERAELTLILPYGTRLDLHWDLVNDPDTRSELRFPTAAALSRVVQVQLGELAVPTFDPADSVLALTLHAALSGATRLMWLNDVRCALRLPELDVRVLMARAHQYGLDLVIALVFDRMNRVFGDAAVSIRTFPSWWRGLAKVVDRIYPPPTLPGDRHTGQLLFRSVRRSSAASARAALLAVLRPPRPTGAGIGNPLHLDRPDVGARSSYFALVERGQ